MNANIFFLGFLFILLFTCQTPSTNKLSWNLNKEKSDQLILEGRKKIAKETLMATEDMGHHLNKGFITFTNLIESEAKPAVPSTTVPTFCTCHQVEDSINIIVTNGMTELLGFASSLVLKRDTFEAYLLVNDGKGPTPKFQQNIQKFYPEVIVGFIEKKLKVHIEKTEHKNISLLCGSFTGTSQVFGVQADSTGSFLFSKQQLQVDAAFQCPLEDLTAIRRRRK